METKNVALGVGSTLIIGATTLAQAQASVMTDLAGDTASGAITEGTAIMASPVGYLVYFVIGLAVVGLIVATVKGFIKKG
jgi:ABC-type thiamin/hydroxymethylpyrimidine transport system permease subunit